MRVHYYKILTDVSFNKISARRVAETLLKNRILLYGIGSDIVTNNGKQLLKTFFVVLQEPLDTKLMTAAKRCSHENGRVQL